MMECVGVDVDMEWYARPHAERVGALAEKWQDELGMDGFTARILREGIRDKPCRPVMGMGRCL